MYTMCICTHAGLVMLVNTLYTALRYQVMDVVCVKDMRDILEYCGKASRMEQTINMLADQAQLYKSGKQRGAGRPELAACRAHGCMLRLGPLGVHACMCMHASCARSRRLLSHMRQGHQGVTAPLASGAIASNMM